MILTLLIIVHILACIWHAVGKSIISETSWVSSYGFMEKPVTDRYLVSFYWAAMTMTTVGYGDITPKNNMEYLCANITMLVACIVFGYTMNRIGMLLSSLH